MAKRLGKALTTGPACASLREHLRVTRLHEPPITSWTVVEDGFLRAMEAFDQEVIAGQASDGERQNGKGDYFNDLLALLLEASSGASLDKRTGVNGLVFPNHSLDITYPQTANAIAEVLVEAKMLGTPQHPGNATTQQREGRPGSADLLKRTKEVGFKTIDLKAGFGMQQAARGEAAQDGMTGDLTSWLRAVKPKSYLALAVRVTSPSDAQAVVTMTQAMTQIVDGCGAFLYRPVGHRDKNLDPPRYEVVPVPAHLEMARFLQRVTLDLRAAKRRVDAAGPEFASPDLPSAAVDAATKDVDDLPG